jgi:hypothetical protein
MLRPTVHPPRPRRRLRGPLGWLGRGVWRLWTLPTNVLGHLTGRLVGRGRPERVRGPAAHAWLYRIRPGVRLDWVGAVTLGHVVLYRPGMFDGRLGRLVLAHELAHTRQHDWLGPLYLPLHILAQTISALLSIGRPLGESRVHDFNPLEQTFICLGASAYGPLARGQRVPGAADAGVDDADAGAADADDADADGADAMLAAFGLD